jgi:hypothetical protein
VVERKENPAIPNEQSQDGLNLGDEILRLLNERAENPGQAFVLLQQLCLFVWDQYQIDWKDKDNQKTADTRKQRYMNYVSDLIDNLMANNVITDKSK